MNSFLNLNLKNVVLAAVVGVVIFGFGIAHAQEWSDWNEPVDVSAPDWSSWNEPVDVSASDWSYWNEPVDVSAPDWSSWNEPVDVNAPEWSYWNESDGALVPAGELVDAPDYGVLVNAPDYGALVNAPAYNAACGCYTNRSSYGPTYSLGGGIGARSGQLGYSSGGSYGSGYPTTGGPNYQIPRYATPPGGSYGGGNNSYTNTNITNTNTEITNIDNSINGSFNNYGSNNVTIDLAPVQQISYPQYPVGYTTPAPYYGNNTYAVNNPYVSLTQIPYTGFDFGTFGNAMYWVTLAAFALGASYLAIYYIPAVAFAGARSQKQYAPVVAPKAPILIEKEAQIAATVAPIVAKIQRNGTNDTMAIVQSKDGSMPRIVIERA